VSAARADNRGALRIFMWHVHGSYQTALLQTGHTFLLPVLPSRGPYGRGRAVTWQWPDNAIEVSPAEAAGDDVDLVVLQRPEEVALAETWLGGRRPGVDVPAVYLEHNTPQGRISEMRHPMAEQSTVTVVHVTHFNDLFWDCGRAPTVVIEHGIVDPGHLADGRLDRAAAVINEPVRRRRVTGSDLLVDLSCRSGVVIDLFGMQSQALGGRDLPQRRLHEEMGRRRAYVHPARWTSLGLSLIEAMHLGLPVVALATTAVVEAVPPEAGVVSNNLDTLARGLRWLAADAEAAAAMGKAARAAALAQFGLERFVTDWNRLLAKVTS
jgi:glycosyltransferase involved in cell wall biosynthesis